MEKDLSFVILVLVNCAILVYGEIRCYCNESGCVRTGYMCKSQEKSCYTLVTVKNEVRESIHGCLDSLSADDRKSCSSKTHHVTRFKRDTHVVSCCDEDMCNYKSAMDINVVVGPQSRVNVSLAAVEDRTTRPWPKIPASDGRDKHLWFKAAVIAVPISGGCILVILILLAVRMLRTDSRRHRQLMDIRNKLAYANSYVTQHFCDDDRKTNVHERLLKTCDCVRPGCAQRDIYGNVQKVKVALLDEFSANMCNNFPNTPMLKCWCGYCKSPTIIKHGTSHKSEVINLLRDTNDVASSVEPVETSLFLCNFQDSNYDAGANPVQV